jgi:hypothetical protein
MARVNSKSNRINKNVTGEENDQLMDLGDNEITSGLNADFPPGDFTEGTLGLHYRDTSDLTIPESKKARRARLASTNLEEVISNSEMTERRASILELEEGRILIAHLATEIAAFKEELTSLKKNNSSVKSEQTNYGFFDNVLMLKQQLMLQRPKLRLLFLR